MQNNKRIMLVSGALASLPAQAADTEIEVVIDDPIDIYDFKETRIRFEKPKRTHPTSWRK